MKQEIFQERKKIRKAWNTPAEKPDSVPKPPPRVSIEERKARKAKAEAELENRGALVETVTVPDPSFGAGKFGKRIEILEVAAPPPPSSSYNPSSYNTPASPAKSQFGEGGDDDIDEFARSPPRAIYENASANELRLLNAARAKAKQSEYLRRKVSRLETFVGNLKKSITSLKNDPTATLPTQQSTSLGEKSMLGTSGGDLAAAINVLQMKQQKQAATIDRLFSEKQAAEKRVEMLEKDLLDRHREEKEKAQAEARGGVAGKSGSVISKVIQLGSNEICEFLTDVEGNLNYFLSFVRRSKALDVNESTGDIELQDGCYFVHGGDGVDRGPGDIRVVKHLTSLKKRYPGRVFLIMGNRDINKLRFMSELHPLALLSGSDIYWDANHKKYDAFCSEKGLDLNDRVSKLKWMLECTMGCENAFEHRRSELNVLRDNAGNKSVSDDEVVESFLDSVDPKSSDPWMLEYIKVGQIMLLLDNCMFVHGGITKDGIGSIPGRPERVDDAWEWCTGLNEWMTDMVEQYERNSLFDQNNTRTFDKFLDYVVPGGSSGKTVICCGAFFSNGNSKAPNVEVERWCNKNGVRRIFSGHVPHGDSPCVIKREELTVFTCDTSFSDVAADDNRGKAVSVTTVCKSFTEVRGVLKDGTVNEFVINIDNSRNDLPYSLVGLQVMDDSWVKGCVKKGESDDKVLLLVKGNGRSIQQSFKDTGEVLSILKVGRM